MDLMHAEIVYINLPGQSVRIPERLGIPRVDQMHGTELERLCELSGRTCYDSLGKGRNSADYHKHIHEVRHGSVYEHANLTVLLEWPEHLAESYYEDLLNRPGVFVGGVVKGAGLRVTLNLRALKEWATAPFAFKSADGDVDTAAYLEQIGHQVAPLIVTDPMLLRERHVDDMPTLTLVPPETDNEVWVSTLVCGSRGFSHEMVRHGDWTAISQRSTRYVDENESPWVDHPLTTLFAEQEKVSRAPNGEATELSVAQFAGHVASTAKQAYKVLVSRLQPWLAAKGVDSTTARKQARGAARGLLGNALYTEIIFSASVAQWKWIIQQRCSPGADAEIRVIIGKALRAFKADPAIADRFSAYTLIPSPDGIGEVVQVAP